MSESINYLSDAKNWFQGLTSEEKLKYVVQLYVDNVINKKIDIKKETDDDISVLKNEINSLKSLILLLDKKVDKLINVSECKQIDQKVEIVKDNEDECIKLAKNYSNKKITITKSLLKMHGISDKTINNLGSIREIKKLILQKNQGS